MHTFKTQYISQRHIYPGLPWWLSSKASACNAGDHLQHRRYLFGPRVGKIPWRRKWQLTPVFLPKKPTDRGAWRARVHGITRVGEDFVTKPPPYVPKGTGQIQHSTCLWGKRGNTGSGGGEGEKNAHIRERASVSPLWFHGPAS